MTRIPISHLERAGWLLVGVLLGAGSTVAAASPDLPDAMYRKLEILAEVFGQIESNYVDPVSATKLVYGAARGAVATLDPHSTFYDPQQYKDLLDSTEGEYAGIGIELADKNKQPEILGVYNDSPAQRAGLVRGDVILAVDGIATQGRDFDSIYRQLRGAVGTKVVLLVQRAARVQPWKFTLVRSWIRVAPLSEKTLPGGIDYIKLDSFPRRVAADLESTLRKHVPKGGLILDLRGNPGGLFDQAVEVCDLFLSSGPIVTAVGRGGRVLEQRKARARTLVPTAPMAILIDGGSASAAEIVAGALHDRGRARLFGSRSYGKGSVQSILDLSDGSGLKLTVARYFTPSGKRIDGRGIEPDQVVKSNGKPSNHDDVVAAAVKWLRQR